MSKPLQIVRPGGAPSDVVIGDGPKPEDDAAAFRTKVLGMIGDIQNLLEVGWRPAPRVIEEADIRRSSSMRSYAQSLYKFRQSRAKYFDGDLFGEAAWDMLLDLFIAADANASVSITSACIASGVPPTTALRWIAILTERGLIERVDDPVDRRRAFVRLTKQGWDAMTRCLEGAMKN